MLNPNHGAVQSYEYEQKEAPMIRSAIPSSLTSLVLPLALVVAIPGLSHAQEGEPPAAGVQAAERAEPADLVELDAEELPKEVIDKLSPEQIGKILMEREITKRAAQSEERVGPEIMVPVSLFVALAVVIGLAIYFGHRRDANRQKTLQAMVEHGVQIPPELLVPPVRSDADLRRGLIFVGTGLGLMAMLGLLPTGEVGVWSVGLIPVLIGVAYLIAWRIGSKRAASR